MQTLFSLWNLCKHHIASCQSILKIFFFLKLLWKGTLSSSGQYTTETDIVSWYKLENTLTIFQKRVVEFCFENKINNLFSSDFVSNLALSWLIGRCRVLMLKVSIYLCEISLHIVKKVTTWITVYLFVSPSFTLD